MIKLYASGSYFGLPDPSPFVVKAMMLFKLADIPYEVQKMSFREAPKAKVPYIRDGDLLLGDSHFIRKHLEARCNADFDGAADAKTLAQHWAVARMMEEHFYFLSVYERWMKEENFNKGPRQFFEMAPVPIRPVLRSMIRSKVRRMLHGQGMGRHSDAERLELAVGDIDAVEALLGENPFIAGAKPGGVDASVFPFLWSASASFFDTSIGAEIRSRPKLMSYMERLRKRFFPEYSQ